MADWPLPGTRTTSWCVDYLVRMGQTIESHHEDFVRRCKLERNSLGANQHRQATNFVLFLAEIDQYDVCNSMSAEAAFRDMQTIEYSYQDKMRDLESSGGRGGQAGRLSTGEQSMFAGSSRLSQSLMVCPALLEQVKQEVDKEGGLFKNLVKAREARTALRKK